MQEKSPVTSPFGPDGQPLVFLRKAFHWTGRWPSPLRQRRIRTLTLLYIKRGAGLLTINHAASAITGHQLLLLAPGMQVAVQPDSLAEWDVHYIAFKLMRPVRAGNGWAIETLDPMPNAYGCELPLADLPAIERLLAQVHSRADEDSDAGALLPWKRQLALAELLYTAMRERNKADRRSVPDAVRECAAYIDRHYADIIRMDELAKRCGLHPSTFSRLFRQIIGSSPSEYLAQVRIEAAKAMLPSPFPLREVARRAGFCDEYYFSRMFKKITGISPSHYTRAVRTQSPGRQLSERMLEPVNVAATYVDEADHLIALGLLPAAVPTDQVPDGSEVPIPYLEPYVCQLPRSGCERHIDKMMLRKLAPELIIAGNFLKDWGVTGLEEIAPTHSYMWEVDWRNIHRQLAAKLGREAQAEQNIARFDTLVRSVRDRMMPVCARKTFVFLESTREGVRISPYMSNGGWLLYQQLGLTPAPFVSVNAWDHFVAPDGAAAIEADFLFVGQRSGSLAVHEQLMGSPGMQQLGPRLIEVPRYPWGKGGPIAFSRGVRLILSVFEKLHK